MAKKEAVIGLDIGSNSVHGVMAKYNEEAGKFEIVSAETVQSEGIKEGAISGIHEASNSINTLFTRLEREHDEEISNIVIAVRGKTIEIIAHNADIKMNENETEISEDTIRDLQAEISSSRKVSDNHEIIQVIPREYILDNQTGIYDPVGMNCKYLELQALLVSVPKSNIQNITKAVELGADSILYGYSAIGDCLVQKDDKEFGCVLIDIGGMTTGIVVYKDSKISTAFEIPIGADLITRDIYKKLRTANQKVARTIKESYGSVFADSDETFEYTATGSKTASFSKSQLTEIIKPQVDLQIDYILGSLKKKNVEVESLSGGVILTGGGSKLNGIIEAFEQGFNCIVKTANFSEDDIIMDQEILNSQIYTTALSVLMKNFRNNSSAGFAPAKKRSKKGSIFSKISRMFEDTF